MTGVVYRHYSSSGELLYIGASINVLARTYQHSVSAKWFKEIATITVEHFPSERVALEAEEIAIRKESPRENFVGIPSDQLRKKRNRSSRLSNAPHDQLDAIIREFNIGAYMIPIFLRCSADHHNELRGLGRRLKTSEVTAIKNGLQTTYKRLQEIGVTKGEPG